MPNQPVPPHQIIKNNFLKKKLLKIKPKLKSKHVKSNLSLSLSLRSHWVFCFGFGFDRSEGFSDLLRFFPNSIFFSCRIRIERNLISIYEINWFAKIQFSLMKKSRLFIHNNFFLFIFG